MRSLAAPVLLSGSGVQAISRDLEAVRAGLQRWFNQHWADDRSVVVGPVSRATSGLSSETLFVEVEGSSHGDGGGGTDALVVRMPPSGPGLFPIYDLGTQGRVQATIARAGLPVAAPLAIEEDPSWVGAPFMVMPRVPGRVLPESPPFLSGGWLYEAAPTEQARLHANFMASVARIHRLDWRALGFEFLARPGEVGPMGVDRPAGIGLEAELGWWTSYASWAADGVPPTELSEPLAWCAANRPVVEPPSSLLWGDARLGNVVFDERLQPVAVLDWELASIGPAEVDLGWFFSLHELSAAGAGGDLPGFPGREEALGSYEGLLGRPLDDLGWYEVFALVRSAAVLLRMMRLGAAARDPGGTSRPSAQARALLSQDNPVFARLRALTA